MVPEHNHTVPHADKTRGRSEERAAGPFAPGVGLPARSRETRNLLALKLAEPRAVVGVIVAYLLLLELDHRVDIIWTPVPLWVPLAALAAVLLLYRRASVVASALWLLGLVSYAWSLAPGDTLLASLWFLPLLALLAAGRSRAVLLVVMTYLMGQSLFSAWALNHFGLQSYTSGSVHYVLGAKALVVLGPALAGFGLARRSWLVLVSWLGATAATYGALMSGSRGVYIPLVIVSAVVVFRLIRRPGTRRRVIVGILLMIATIIAVDSLLPSHPVAEALFAKASFGAQAAAVQTSGNFTERLRFWDQGLAMVLAHPLGVGFGGFRSTIHAFQRFPMVWSSSPHNVFVEIAATLGWPGLALLVALLLIASIRAWRSERWPWALSLLGIWFTLGVDVTADYPKIMGMAFAVVGACLGPVAASGPQEVRKLVPAAHRLRAVPYAAAVVVLAGAVLTAWWFTPCDGSACSLTRYRGVEYRVTAAVPALEPAARASYFAHLERLYPVSLWVLDLEERYSTSSAVRLSLAREIATRFPLQSWKNYLIWADLSLQAHDMRQAREAATKGLAVFGPDSRRYPGARADPTGFKNWLAQAEKILMETSPRVKDGAGS